MPIFEYKCLNCKKTYEIMDTSADKISSKCPKCGSDKAEKLLSSFATRSSQEFESPCSPKGCDFPQDGGMPPCGAGGCGMM